MRRPAYLRPTSIEEAVAALRETPDARMIAGGTDLMVQMRLGQVSPPLVVDTIDLAELHEISVEPGRGVRIGAAVPVRAILGAHRVVDRYPALAQAARLLGGPQIQAMATIGGNLCNGSPAAETAGPLLVHDASIEVVGAEGRRALPLRSLWLGPRRTALQQGELMVGVRLPEPEAPTGSAYRRLELRRSVDIALVSAAVSITVRHQRIHRAVVAIGAAHATPLLVPAAGEALVGVSVTAADLAAGSMQSAVDVAADACRAAADPIDDLRASASYRSAMLTAVTSRAAFAALESAQPP